MALFGVKYLDEQFCKDFLSHVENAIAAKELMFRSKKSSQRQAERKPEKKVRQHQSTLRLFSQVEIPSEALRDLLRAAEYGDIPSVQVIVANNPLLNTNGPDMFGRTALQIAVTNEHAEIVEILLDHSSPANIYLALLLAINHNYENITELILHHPIYRQYHDKWADLATKLPDTSPFADDISPIILACQKNLFGIVHLLLQDGMRVPVPHHFDCACERCLETRMEDQFKHAKRRLNEYRALTSEAYISLTSPDPFQTAFELCHEMELRATWEKHFKREYKTLVAQMRRYAVKLMDCVRTHDELTTILDWPGVTATLQDNGDTERRATHKNAAASLEQMTPQSLSRLRVAISYRQKEFVSHWACQQQLMQKWQRGFLQYRDSSSHSKIFTNLALTLLAYPVLMVFHWVQPEGNLGRLITRPLVKFVAYSMSYLAFLGILSIITVTPTGFYAVPQKLSEIKLPAEAYQPLYDIILHARGLSHDDHGTNDLHGHLNLFEIVRDFCNESQKAGLLPVEEPPGGTPVVEDIGCLSTAGVWQICKLDKDFIVRPNADNWVCWIVTVWLLGLFFSKFRKIFGGTFPLSGLKGVKKWSGLRGMFHSPFDMIDVFQLAFFAGAFASRVYAYIRVTESVVFFLSLRPSLSHYTLFPRYLYWLPSDRVYFHQADPLTISELLFAIGSIFSFARLLYIFPALEVFGPCYLALMRVVKDIVAFFFVFLVVFAAFMIGTMNIYWYFNPELRHMLQLNESYEPEIPAERRFGNIELTFRTVFWSLFGLGESDYMSIANFGNGSMIWVERIGYFVYGAYSIFVVVVLLNMLIAMMAKSYEAVKLNAEMEWKFARTILFLEYIPEQASTIPTPFNLIPNPRYLRQFVTNLISAVRPFRRYRVQPPVQSAAVFITSSGTAEEGDLHSRQDVVPTSSCSDVSVGGDKTKPSQITAPVQIRIEQTDDESSPPPNASFDDDTSFTVEFVPAGSNKQNLAPKTPLRVEQGTMTSDTESNTGTDMIESCCNFCSLRHLLDLLPHSTPPTTSLRREQLSVIAAPADTGSSKGPQRYGDNLYLSVPGSSKMGPHTTSANTSLAGSTSGVTENQRNVVASNQNPALFKFRAVVFNILKRYILGLSTRNANNIDTSVDLEEIKQDISSFRFEVLNLLTDNTPSVGGMPMSAVAGQNSQVATLSRTKHKCRTQINGSPLSVKSLSAVDANNNSNNNSGNTLSGPRHDLMRENSISNNNLLMVSSPGHHFLTPTSDFNSEQNSPIQPLVHADAGSSPSVSVMNRSPRITRPYGHYRRRSIVPSSLAGSLLPPGFLAAIATGDSQGAENENENDNDNDSATSAVSGSEEHNTNNITTTPPRSSGKQRLSQRPSPSNRGLLGHNRSSSNDVAQQQAAFLEEVDEETEEGYTEG